jgi:hypothetical protein
MKTDCAYTRKSLRKYLHGHLFKPEQIRVERHLRSCVMCYTEYQALEQAAEAKQYLKDITPPEGIVQRVQAGVSGLAKLKKILYRPLWLAGIITVIVLAYIYVLAPPRRDLEIENLEKSGTVSSAPLSAAPASPAQGVRPSPVTAPATTVQLPASQPDEAVRTIKPLRVTITVDDEKAAIRRINEVMRGHGELRKMRFSDTVREISGSMTSKELLTFFSMIETEGKISYRRKRLAAFPSAQPVPFVMNLKVAPQAAGKPSQAEQPVVTPAEATVSSQQVTAPSQSAVP